MSGHPTRLGTDLTTRSLGGACGDGRARWTLALALVAAACGAEPTVTTDAGTFPLADAGRPARDANTTAFANPEPPAAPALPEPPVPPIAPVFGACPTGFSSTEVSGVGTCETADPPRCERGAYAPTSAGACRPIGAACEEGLPRGDATARYVDPTADPGGSGSREAPFRSIDEALAAALPNAQIVLAPGRHEWNGEAPATSARVVGACASATTVVLTGSATASVCDGSLTDIGLSVRAGTLEFSRLRLESERTIALAVLDGARVALDDTELAVRGAAVTVAGGALDLRGVKITARDAVSTGDALRVSCRGTVTASALEIANVGGRGVALLSGSGTLADLSLHDLGGAAIVADAAATLSVERASIRRVAGGGLHARSTDTLVTASDLRIDVVHPGGSPAGLGMGVLVEDGATVRLARANVSDVSCRGLAAIGARSRLEVDDVIVRKVRAVAAVDPIGPAVSAESGASLVARRVVVRDAEGTGAFFVDTRAEVAIEDLDVAELGGFTGAPRPGASIGAAVQGVRRFSLRRAAIDRPSGRGMQVEGSTVTLEDVAISDVSNHRAESFDGSGIDLIDSGGSLTRVALARLWSSGLYFNGAGRFVLRDIDIDTVEIDRGFVSGAGIAILARAELDAERVRVRRSGLAALVSDHPTPMKFTDLRVEDTIPDPSGIAANVGGGVLLFPGANLTLERAYFHRTMACALFALEASLTARDVEIDDVRVEHRTGDDGFGTQFIAATIDVERMLVQRAHEVGFSAVSGTDVVARDLLVRDTYQDECRDSATFRCPDPGGAIGVVVADGARMTASNFMIDRSELVGIYVGDGTNVTLSRGVVTDNPLGAVVNAPDFDFSGLARDVRFMANDRNLDTDSALPVPGTAFSGT